MTDLYPCSIFEVTWRSGEKRCKHCSLKEEEHTAESRMNYDKMVGKDPESLRLLYESEQTRLMIVDQQRKTEAEFNKANVSRMLAIYEVGMKVFDRLGNSQFEGSIVAINEEDETCDCEVLGSIETRMPFCALQPRYDKLVSS